MRLIDADRLQKQFNAKSSNPNYRVNMHNIKSIITNAPTVEAIPKAEYEAKLKDDTLAVLEKIADEINKRIQALSYSAKLSDIGTKVGYMYSLALIRANIHALKENGEK